MVLFLLLLVTDGDDGGVGGGDVPSHNYSGMCGLTLTYIHKCAYNTSHVDPPNEPIHSHRTQLTYVTAYRCDILISFGVLCTALFAVFLFDIYTDSLTRTPKQTISREKQQPENKMQNPQHRNMSP